MGAAAQLGESRLPCGHPKVRRGRCLTELKGWVFILVSLLTPYRCSWVGSLSPPSVAWGEGPLRVNGQGMGSSQRTQAGVKGGAGRSILQRLQTTPTSPHATFPSLGRWDCEDDAEPDSYHDGGHQQCDLRLPHHAGPDDCQDSGRRLHRGAPGRKRPAHPSPSLWAPAP